MTTSSRRPISLAVPDASLVAKWHTPSEAGWEHAQTFARALGTGDLRLTAPEHLKIEVIRVLQLGVRDKLYSMEAGLSRVEAFLALPIAYVSNDLLFGDAFQLASRFAMALYDAIYVALANALDIPFLTADRRLYNLAVQRGLPRVCWFADCTPAGLERR